MASMNSAIVRSSFVGVCSVRRQAIARTYTYCQEPCRKNVMEYELKCTQFLSWKCTYSKRNLQDVRAFCPGQAISFLHGSSGERKYVVLYKQT